MLALTIWQRALWPQCKWDCFAASTVSGGGGMGVGQTTGQAAGRQYSACAVILFCLNSKKSSKVFFEPKTPEFGVVNHFMDEKRVDNTKFKTKLIVQAV